MMQPLLLPIERVMTETHSIRAVFFTYDGYKAMPMGITPNKLVCLLCVTIGW